MVVHTAPARRTSEELRGLLRSFLISHTRLILRDRLKLAARNCARTALLDLPPSADPRETEQAPGARSFSMFRF